MTEETDGGRVDRTVGRHARTGALYLARSFFECLSSPGATCQQMSGGGGSFVFLAYYNGAPLVKVRDDGSGENDWNASCFPTVVEAIDFAERLAEHRGWTPNASLSD